MNIFLRSKYIILSGVFTVKEIDFEKFKVAEGLYITDPWERVKSIFSVDDFGNWHPELLYTYHMIQAGTVCGGVFGGIIEAIKAANNFFRTNDTQIYANRNEYERALNNVNILSMGKGAIKWAPRFAVFCGGFVFVSSCCDLYYNEHRIINNTIAGFSVGALLKCHFGIKGIISGGTIGGALGTLYGIALCGIYKISNTNHMQFKYANFAYIKYKEQSKINRNSKTNLFDDTSILNDSDSLNVSEIEEHEVQKSEKLKT